MASGPPHLLVVAPDHGAPDRLRAALDAQVFDRFVRVDAADLPAAQERLDADWIVMIERYAIPSERALAELALALTEARRHGSDPVIVYGDEDHVDGSGRRSEPLFKPRFGIDRLLGGDLLGGLVAVRAEAARSVGGVRSGSAPVMDLALRVLARMPEATVLHVREVLAHRLEARTPADAKAERPLIATYLESQAADTARPATVEPDPLLPTAHRIAWPLPDDPPLVSVIVPTRDAGGLVRQCLDGVLNRTGYPRVEILLVDNGSTDPASLATFRDLASDERVRVIERPGPFNYAALNNDAAREANGALLLLLNNDIDVIGPRWLDELVSLAARPGVGIVGAKLLFADGRVQHGGIRLGMGEFRGTPHVAGHLGLFLRADDPSYMGDQAITRDVGAVTAACMMVRREAYEAVGGMDEARLPVAFNDVDLCLRVREAGWRVLYAPHATLHHLESATRGSDAKGEKLERFARDVRAMRERWGERLDDDPFYSTRFDYSAGDYVVDARC